MSFSRKVKEELGALLNSGRHCCIAEFAAIFALCGKIKSHRRGKISLQMHSENLTVIRKSYILLKDVFGVSVEMIVRNYSVHGENIIYMLFVRKEADVLFVLKAIKMLDEEGNLWGVSGKMDNRLVQNSCCKRAYLRGSYLVAGSITNPEKAYHLEISLSNPGYAMQLQGLAADFGIEAKIVERKKYQVLYIKEGAQIVDFLNVVGAHVAMMDLENVRIVKEVRNNVNRQVNCETANINKTVTAAARQMDDIRYLQNNKGFSRLTDGLREIAELRMEYPDCSLQELGQMLLEPISKSGVNHRLRKISKIAEEMREENQGVSKQF